MSPKAGPKYRSKLLEWSAEDQLKRQQELRHRRWAKVRQEKKWVIKELKCLKKRVADKDLEINRIGLANSNLTESNRELTLQQENLTLQVTQLQRQLALERKMITFLVDEQNQSAQYRDDLLAQVAQLQNQLMEYMPPGEEIHAPVHPSILTDVED